MATGDPLTVGAAGYAATTVPSDVGYRSNATIDAGAGNDITVADSMAALDTVFPFKIESPKTFRLHIASKATLVNNRATPPTGGTFTLTVGVETTAAIAYNADAAAIKVALELLSGVTTATVAFEFGANLGDGSGTQNTRCVISLDGNAGQLSANLGSITGGTVTFDRSVTTGDAFSVFVRANADDATYSTVTHTATAGQTAEDVAAALAAAWNAHGDALVSDQTATHSTGNTYFDVAVAATIHAHYIQARPDNQVTDPASANIRLELIEDPPSPLMARQMYWARKTSATELKVYNTKADADNARNEIILQDTGGAVTHQVVYFGTGCAPVMAWTRVQNLDFTGDLKIGVDVSGWVHEHGGGTVEFTANGSTWVEADTRTRNDQRAMHADSNIATPSTEYWVTLPVSGLSAGQQVEVRARWTPGKVGKGKVLQGAYTARLDSGVANGDSTFLNNSSFYCEHNGSPQTVELANGNYTWGVGPLALTQTNASEWLTIRPAAGASKANVVITADNGSGTSVSRVRFQGITINGPATLSGFGNADMWLDDVDWTTAAASPGSQTVRRMFVTASKRDGVRTGALHFVDGSVFVNIREDVFQYLQFLNDCEVQSMNTLAGGHPAVVANPTGYNNRLVRQLVTANTITAKVWALRQGVSNTSPAAYTHTDVAFVDCDCPRSAASSSNFAFFGGQAHNVYFGNNDFRNSSGGLTYRGPVSEGDSDLPGFWRFNANDVVYDSVEWATNPDASVPGTSFAGVIIRGENFAEWTETDLNWNTSDTTTAASSLDVSGSLVTITDQRRGHVGHLSRDFGDQHFFQGPETFIGRFQFSVFQSARFCAVLAFGDAVGNLDDGTAAFKLNNAITLQMGLQRDPGGTDSYERGLHLVEFVSGSDVDSTYSRATTDVADTGYPAAGTLDAIADASDNAAGYFKWVFDPTVGTHGRHTVYVYATLADLEADANELTGGSFWLEPTTSQSASGGPNRWAMVANGRGDNSTTADTGTSAVQGLVADIDLTFGQDPLVQDIEPSIDDQTPDINTQANLTGPVASGGVEPYSYGWTTVSSPGGSTVTFGNSSAQNTSVEVDVAGSYVVRCTVTDDASDSFTADVAFEAVGDPEPAPVSSSIRSANLGVSGIAAALAAGTWQSGPHQGQSVRALMLGDSITNINTNAGGNAANQDSYPWGIMRQWNTEWSGFTSPTNSAFPDMAYAADAISGLTRAYGYANQNSPSVTSGDANFSLRIPIELRFASDDTGTGTWFQQRWETGGAWIDKFWVDQAMDAEFWYFRTPETPDEIEVLFQHQGTGGSQVTAVRTGCAGAASPAKLTYPQPTPGNGILRINVTQATGYNESAKDLIIYGIHVRKRTGTGFELCANGVGGAKYENYIDADKFITDQHLSALHGDGGVYTPNLLMIALGANDGSNLTQQEMEDLVERFGSIVSGLHVVFLIPFGTPSSISQETALEHAAMAEAICRRGTASVPARRIAMINTPLIVGAAEAGDLVDTIHPKRSFVDEVAGAWWTQVTTLEGDASVASDMSLGRARARGRRSIWINL